MCIRDSINTGLDELNKEAKFSIYPNPVTDQQSITIFSIEKNTCTILDVTGKVIQENTLETGENKIQNRLPSGIYFIKIGNTTQKLVIQ